MLINGINVLVYRLDCSDCLYLFFKFFQNFIVNIASSAFICRLFLSVSQQNKTLHADMKYVALLDKFFYFYFFWSWVILVKNA